LESSQRLTAIHARKLGLNPRSGIPICDTAATTPAGQIDWRDLVALKFELPEQYQARGSYLMNGRTLGMCMTMTDAAARPILLPVPITSDGRVGSGFMIAGSPVHIVTQFPDVAPGSTPIAFGDWEQVYLKFSARIGGGILCPGAGRSDVPFQGARSRLSMPRALRANSWEVDVAVQGRRRDRWTSVDLL
jgi:hypothetical protein